MLNLFSIVPSNWKVNNCFQLDSGIWRVNLRAPAPNGNFFTDFAEGKTPEQALRNCLDKIEDAVFIAERKQQSYSIEETPVLSLSNLNLSNSTPIKRRV